MLRPKTTANMIGINIKKLRKEKGLTQMQMADNQISYVSVSNIENGRKIPSIKSLEIFCRTLECKSSDLLPF